MGGSVQPTERHHALEDNHISVTRNVGGSDIGTFVYPKLPVSFVRASPS